jgi:putative hemolysin
MNIFGRKRAWVLLLALIVVLAAGGCGETAISEPTPILSSEEESAAPWAALQARMTVLDFLREGANECVPPAGVRWQTAVGNAPQGFEVYRFAAEDCTMTVSYPLPADEDTLYHVSLQSTGVGFCWQANVDAAGEIVATGKAAEMIPALANAAAAYCEEQGYRYQIQEEENGSRCGVCVFSDEAACNAWSFFQGECGPP